MRQEAQVREGQRYAKVYATFDSTKGWEVRSICKRVVPLPHAKLVNLEDPSDIRMVSCGTVADDRYFRLMSEPRVNGTPAE
jgi:hypothetical protein